MSDSKLVVATHDGRHHADEVLACWFFRVLHGPDIQIVRTSDADQQRQADVLLDCGGEFDPGRGRFDHHGEVRLPSPHPYRICEYATAGLVWRTYGRRICRLLLSNPQARLWADYVADLPVDDYEEALTALALTMEQEIVAPIDAWDLGLYPERHVTRQIIPFQWILPHLEFETAVAAVGRAFTHRLWTLAETMARESNLEHDLLENGPCEFWVLGPWLVVKAQDGHRVELRAAKRFALRTMNMPLLAVISSIRGGSRWGAFLTVQLPYGQTVPSDLEYAAGRRSFFHDDALRLLAFLRECAEGKQLPLPGFGVESPACQPE